MRKVSVLSSVALVATLGLAGCSAGPQSNSGGANGNDELTISGFAGDPSADPLIAAFEKENPGVSVKFTGLPYPQILSQINTELVSGNASDIVAVFPGNGSAIATYPLAKGKYLADLSDSEWVSNYNDANKTVMGTDGQILMGANAFTIIPAIYNSQALEAVGATAPQTFSEVLALCDTAKSQGKVAYALAAAAGGNVGYYPYALYSTLVAGKDADFVTKQADGDVTFSNSEWTTVLEKFEQMLDAGCFTQDSTGTSAEVAQGQVSKGDALGIVTVSPVITALQTEAPEGTTFETASFPATDDPSETVLPVGLGAGYGVNAKSDKIDLAKKFIDFYMSEEGLKIALEYSSIYPSAPVDGYTPPEALAGIAEQAQGDQTAAFPDQTWPNAVVSQTFSDGLQSLIGGQSSAADLLKQLDSAYKG